MPEATVRSTCVSRYSLAHYYQEIGRAFSSERSLKQPEAFLTSVLAIRVIRICGHFVPHMIPFLRQVCLVVFHSSLISLSQSNIYHIAFVAARDIPAGSEFTIDYAPGAIPEDAPPGAPQCHCGAQACRRWYRAHG